MKHRRKSHKIKYEHKMLKGLREVLEEIETWDEVTSIIPGKISPAGSVQRFKLVAKVDTPTGIKTIAYSGNAVQEVFMVSTNREGLRVRLRSLEDAKNY